MCQYITPVFTEDCSALQDQGKEKALVSIDEDANTIQREVRVLPNRLRCGLCNLSLTSYQELKGADLGSI
jgi:hypothetical protein